LLTDSSLSFLPGPRSGCSAQRRRQEHAVRIMAASEPVFSGTPSSRPAPRSACCRRARARTPPRRARERRAGRRPRQGVLGALRGDRRRLGEEMSRSRLEGLLEGVPGGPGTRSRRGKLCGPDRSRGGHGRAAGPAGEPPVSSPLGRRAPAGRSFARILLSEPDLLLLDEPTNHATPSRGLARALLAEVRGDGGVRSSTTATPGQCRRWDPGARPRRGDPRARGKLTPHGWRRRREG